MTRGTAEVEWTRDGETHVASVRKEATRRFRIEERTLFVVIEERPDDYRRSGWPDGVPLLGSGWTKNAEEIGVADTSEAAEEALRRHTAQEPYW